MSNKSSIHQWETLIGNTPLFQLTHICDREDLQILAKLEMFNLGGSIKDRPALNIIKKALDEGAINSDSTIIEASSGNMAVGMAQVCRKLGLKFIAVVDIRTNPSNINIVRAYGGAVDVVGEESDSSSTLLKKRNERLQALLKETPNAFWPDQFSNPDNAKSHWETMQEITDVLGNVDYVLCATGTCGTARGCSDFIKEHNLPTKVIAVDAEGSAIFGQPDKHRLIPGHGATTRPALCTDNVASTVVHVSDEDCISGCREMMDREALFIGGSSGGIVSALLKTIDSFPSGSTVVLILADRGERYLDTIYNTDWVSKHFPALMKN